jgi:hypothetical protein
MNDFIAEKIKEVREKFHQDKSGEKVEGWLAMHVAYHASAGREMYKIAIPDDIERWLSQAFHDLREHVRAEDIEAVEKVIDGKKLLEVAMDSSTLMWKQRMNLRAEEIKIEILNALSSLTNPS